MVRDLQSAGMNQQLHAAGVREDADGARDALHDLCLERFRDRAQDLFGEGRAEGGVVQVRWKHWVKVRHQDHRQRYDDRV